jgi:hypothetical protein
MVVGKSIRIYEETAQMIPGDSEEIVVSQEYLDYDTRAKSKDTLPSAHYLTLRFFKEFQSRDNRRMVGFSGRDAEGYEE